MKAIPIPSAGFVAVLTDISMQTLQAFIQPFQKELLVWTLVALGISVLSVLLMGLPGALLLEIPIRLRLCRPIKGDNAWPAALVVSVLWPIGIPVGVLVKHYLLQTAYAPYA